MHFLFTDIFDLASERAVPLQPNISDHYSSPPSAFRQFETLGASSSMPAMTSCVPPLRRESVQESKESINPNFPMPLQPPQVQQNQSELAKQQEGYAPADRKRPSTTTGVLRRNEESQLGKRGFSTSFADSNPFQNRDRRGAPDQSSKFSVYDTGKQQQSMIQRTGTPMFADQDAASRSKYFAPNVSAPRQRTPSHITSSRPTSGAVRI